MSDLAKRIAELTPEKRELLSQLLQNKLLLQQLQDNKEGIAQVQILPHARDTNVFPLSFAQERLWFLQRLEPQSAFYHMPLALHLTGWLCVDALERSLAVVVQRHEVLRTTFPVQKEQPVQVIAPSFPIQIAVVDLQDPPAVQGTQAIVRDRQVVELARAEAQQPFDLTHGPLLRVCLLRLHKQEQILLFTSHHIVCDGWSMKVLIREVITLYQAQMKGELFGQAQGTAPVATPQGPTLPELPIQYADYTLWQRQRLQESALSPQRDYWLAQLANLSTLDLPTDHPRPPVQSHHGATQACLLPLTLLQQLHHLSLHEGVTLFMLGLSAFQILLARYSGQSDVAVGTTIANRRSRELEGLIGCFFNTLVLRGDLSGNPPFRQFLQQVRKSCLDAYANQDIPFEQLVEQLHPIRNLSHNPLFQALFELDNTPLHVQEFTSDLSVRTLAYESETAKVDLALRVTVTEQGLSCQITYSTDLFEPETTLRMLHHYQTLLEGIVHNPDQPLWELPLLTTLELHELLVTRNQTQADYPHDLCFHQLFVSQVVRTPDAIAATYQEQHLSYQELDRRTNQLACILVQQGVGPEVCVGICMQRSLDLLIGLLGILKAGGAFLPLDPTFPQERMAFMLSDAEARLLLTQQSLLSHLPQTEIPIFCLDTGWEQVRAYPTTQRPSPVTAQHLAYIIYTSGSTGKPKGVLIHHRGFLNYLVWCAEAYGAAHGRGAPVQSTIAADAIFPSLFAPLLIGRTVTLLEESHALSALAQAFEQLGHFSLVKITPSQLETLTPQLPQRDANAFVHTLVIGAEALRGEILTYWQTYAPEAILLNEYGPTETVVGCSIYHIPAGKRISGAVPIGLLSANMQFYVLDSHLQPVPIGVQGELFIGGDGLAWGYLGRPDITASAFIPHPFAGTGTSPVQPGERLYKTGDVVRYLPDRSGNIEFLGRLDHQVKIHGYRIELGEIEAQLMEHPAVQDCIVMARDVASGLAPEGEIRLVAYVIVSEPSASLPSTLRGSLREKLPEYMVPAAIVGLVEWPLTTNGKVDRSALLMPEIRERERTFVAARTAVEQVLAGIWEDVLGGEIHVGIHDDFFELGGHSLLVTQVVARVRQALQVDLPLRSLFETPTIAQLASHLEELIRGASSPFVPALLPMERPIDLPLSFAQERLWFLDQWEPGSAWYNMAIALRLAGRLAVAVLERSLARVVQRHEVLRTTFEERLGRPVQVIAPAGTEQWTTMQAPVASNPLVPVIDLGGLATAERREQVGQLQHAEAQRPFDLSRGPLLRVCLLRLNSREAVGTGIPPIGANLKALGEMGSHATNRAVKFALMGIPPVPQEHVLLFTLHHIVTDAWSMGVLVHEMTTLYQAEMKGEPGLLPQLPIQYADYAIFQRQFLQGEVLDAQMAYWRKQLADLSPLALPTNYPRPKVKTDQGARQFLRLSRAFSDQLLHLCRKMDVTLFMLLLSTFQVLLMRYTGQTDISVGTPVANRSRAEVEGLIGFFLNTLVLRTDLGGDPTFEQLLRRVREVCLQAYVHQDVPFEKVVEALEPERDLSRSPLFQVMLVLQNTPLEGGIALTPDLAGVGDTTLFPVITPLTAKHVTSKYDLMLSLSETQQGLDCFLEYSTDLFEEAFITRMLAHFQTLLQGIVDNPQARLPSLPLLTQEEQEQLLVQWNATRTDTPEQVCVHQLIAQQAEQTPDAIALVFEDEELTYAELNRRANQLAHYLHALGVGPEALVGVSLSRSIEMVVGYLSVLKAGGAYVPLDPSYPRERLAWILADSQVEVVLTHHHEDGGLGQVSQCIHLATDWQVIEQARPENPQTSVAPAHLAYLIYTSGSTGVPKGVQIPHHAVTNFLTAMRRHLNLTAEETLLAVTNVSFDIAGLELFLPLVTGARVVVVRQEVARDGERLGQALIEYGATIMQATPSTWRLLLSASGLAHSTLRVLCGGETLPPDLAEQLLDLVSVPSSGSRKDIDSRRPTRGNVYPPNPNESSGNALGDAVWNLYGPTETTIWSTVYAVESLEGLLPIGRPIDNTQIYLLDSNLSPVPVGVPGELYIGGEGLARGYWKRPDLTAERFIANPFAGQEQEPCSVPTASLQSGTRLYRTGDLARYRSDGAIEYLGRIDHQVKLRGYRIELGEIETTLRAYPGVQEAVVILREEDEARKYLAAYVVPLGEQARQEELQNYLREQLPDYMMPAVFVSLATLPLTPNGKVDHKALAVIDPLEQAQKPHKGRELADTPLQELLVTIWKEVLHLPEIGIHESFFEIGGHSLLATQVIARIRRTFQVDPSLRSLFEAPTIAGLCHHLEELMRGTPSLPVPALVPIERDMDLPLSFAQQRLWFLDQLQPGSVAYLMPSVQHIHGPLKRAVLEKSFSALIRRHESLRTTFSARAGQPTQIIHPASQHCLPLIDLRELKQECKKAEVRKLAKHEAQHPCDLEQGPLLRTALLQLDPSDGHALLITLHHIITDGWSNRVLMRELITCYHAFACGQLPELAPLPIQYADYALWQRQYLQGEVLVSQLDYWTRRLRGAPALELPTDYPYPSVPGSHGAIHSFVFPRELLDALVGFSHQEGATLFMTLLSAFQVLLYRSTGQLDIVVGTDSANRNQLETEGIIGFFVNLLVLRTDLRGKPTFREVLKRVREVVLGAYTHQETPFELLVEKLAPDRHLGRTPLVQALFVFESKPLEPESRIETTQLEVGDQSLHLASEDEETVAKFDLTLFMQERDGSLSGELHYRLDLFKASTIATLVAHLEALLQSSIRQPDVPIDLLSMAQAEAGAPVEQWDSKQELLESNDIWFDLA